MIYHMTINGDDKHITIRVSLVISICYVCLYNDIYIYIMIYHLYTDLNWKCRNEATAGLTILEST